MESQTLNIELPNSWAELADKQLCYVYKLIASDFDVNEVKTLCLLRWAGIKIKARVEDFAALCRFDGREYIISVEALAAALGYLDWLDDVPSSPVRPAKVGRHRALPADLQGVTFETYMAVDNLYQGYLYLKKDNLLDELASILYPGILTPLAPWARIAVFYWVASLKIFFAAKWPDFLSPISDGNLLGSSPTNAVEEAMNAQIRALTKGDVTREAEVLALDTWRALTELNAQAKEYKQLNAQLNAKK